MGKLPGDPVMCMSYVNTMLRDRNIGLEELCEDLEEDAEVLKEKLSLAGFLYDEEQRKFR